MKALLPFLLLAAASAAAQVVLPVQMSPGGSSGTAGSSVDTDASLTGDGAPGNPLKLAASVTCTTCTVTGNAFSVGGSTLAVVGGKVGVGTASPSDRLDVAASASFRAQLTVAGASATIKGDLGLPSVTQSSALCVNASGKLSVCTSVVGVGGDCTCP